MKTAKIIFEMVYDKTSKEVFGNHFVNKPIQDIDFNFGNCYEFVIKLGSNTIDARKKLEDDLIEKKNNLKKTETDVLSKASELHNDINKYKNETDKDKKSILLLNIEIKLKELDDQKNSQLNIVKKAMNILNDFDLILKDGYHNC